VRTIHDGISDQLIDIRFATNALSPPEYFHHVALLSECPLLAQSSHWADLG